MSARVCSNVRGSDRPEIKCKYSWLGEHSSKNILASVPLMPLMQKPFKPKCNVCILAYIDSLIHSTRRCKEDKIAPLDAHQQSSQ